MSSWPLRTVYRQTGAGGRGHSHILCVMISVDYEKRWQRV